MARLIPRKQIEEQQNITGSLEIGQDIIVGGNSIVAGNSVISGSLEVLQDFFLGDQLTDRGEVTGSVFLTGSLEIDGDLIFAGPEAVLSATSSNALLAQDTLRYEGLRAKDFGANVPTLYVSSTDGDDANDGRTIQFPLRTIKRAAQLAQPGYDGRYGFDTGSVFNGYVIKVQAGTYLEDNPVILPSNTTIWGSGLRITKVNAKNPEQDLFWVNSGCYIAEITMGGLRLWPNEKEPQRGFGVAFQPGAFITTSPYIQNCSQISNQENSFTELYETIPPGGGGLYVNGDAVDPDSPLASMVLDAYTQISPNGVGCLVNGRGFIQLVSFFTNFSYYAIRVNNGGHATLNNSNISFGLYGMYASGSRFISGSGGNTDARDAVRASYSVIVDVLNKGLEDGLPSITTKNTDAGIRATAVADYPQYQTSSGVVQDSDRANEIVADFELVSQIVDNGTSNFPTLIAKSSTKGYGANSPYNILGTPQITSSVSATAGDLQIISASYGAILDIFNDGTASYDYVTNTTNIVKVTDTEVSPLTPEADYSSSLLVSSSFVTIYDIINGGVSEIPTLISNNSASIKVTDTYSQFTTGLSSSLSVRNEVSASFSIVYNILANGTGSSILDIPENHQRTFTVRKSNDNTKYVFGITGSAGNGDVENASLTLFRGETYRFFVSAGLGTDAEPFFIRKSPTSGFDYQNVYDYSEGVINNGDSNGVITFAVPYDAPNKLYYISQDTPSYVGEINVYNSSTTPRELIEDTLTYPATLASSSVASTDVDKINGYDVLIQNIPFIQDETIAYLSSSWSDFSYNQDTCKRDISYIVNGVAYDLLYGGNEESIRSGLFYYLYPSDATTTQLGPTLTAVKYAAGMAGKLLENRTFVDYNIDKYTIAESIRDNKLFVQNETIAYLSSSWSGFYYNEASCSRDVGYILDAVATDLVYGGNERAIEAGVYYYQYPSLATVANTTTGQLNQTLDGVHYAAGTTLNIITGSTFQTASDSRIAAAQLLKDNKELIQDETIQYINVQYPTLDYNTSKCRRDVGYILDAVATDLIYGGNESSTRAGNFYYLYPSVATSTQRKETKDGFLYSKIIGEYIVQNIILDTPRIITNDERLIKVTGLTNETSSFSGTADESSVVSSSFAIIEGIIKRGTGAIQSLLAQNSGTNWSIDNPLSVTTGSQTTSSYVEPSELETIKEGFERVNSIIESGVSAIPTLTASVEGLIKVTDGEQTLGSVTDVSLTGSISSSFAYVVRVISGGTGSLETLIPNTSASIKVTSTPQWVSANIGTNSQTSSISSSFGAVIDIINNGLDVVPTLVQNTTAGITTSGTSQFTGSLSGSLEDIQFISASVSKVTQIIETGNVDLFGKENYTTPSTTPSTLAAYEIIRENIDFIQEETIAYLSSSWSTFDYDEVKCKRDVGLIISGAAEDLVWNTNSASIVNGQFYYEFPSQATGNQLAQTLDGINYASRLAQKLVTNALFVTASSEVSASNALLFNNKEFIQNETIAYLSSSWGGFEYNEASCSRDVGYIIDAVRTDLVYGGNERTRIAGEYYFLFPSAATGSQLLQTTDGVLYASRLAQSIVSGSVFVSADSEKVEASRLLRENKALIADEVVEYVSSSWSGVLYNEDKCKRDVGYIIDAVRTDLVYGGNERSTIAGDFYFRFPSSATVAGVPTSTAQLDPTVTGVEYANRLSQKVILSEVLSQPSQSVTDAAELIRASRDFIQQNTIDFVYEKYPTFTYDVTRCRRDTGFIVDAVVTDLVYGGNERTSTAGYFYYKYPSQATDAQVEETVAAINYAKELTKLIAVDKKAIEETYDSVDRIILSGSAGVSSITLVENTQKGIVVTGGKQVSQTNGASDSDTQIVSASFGNVINIINNGTGSIPTIVTNTERGVNRIGGTQITSSLDVSSTDKNIISSSFDIVLDVVENGLGSIPTLVRNSAASVKVTSTPQYVSASSATANEATQISESISIVTDIITNGIGATPTIVTNDFGNIKVTETSQNTSLPIATSTEANALSESISLVSDIVYYGTTSIPTITKNSAGNIKVTNSTIVSSTSATATESTQLSSSISSIVDIITNGASSAPTLVENTDGNIKVTNASQYISSSYSGSLEDVDFVSSSISIVTKIVELGSGSYESAGTYSSRLTTENAIAAYEILKNNISFIQDETIAYLSSSWTTASYDESRCRRDVGLIISGAAEDLIWNTDSASIVNGKFYLEYPSQAETSQLFQTLDGINYASRLAQKLIQNIEFVAPSSNKTNASTLLVNNKEFIQNETIAYMSSSWDEFSYSEELCRRDISHIIDAVRTDLVYGGNERSRQAGLFYYSIPSLATSTQLNQTTDAVNYASDLVQKIVVGESFTSAETNKVRASNIIRANKDFIADEVVAYVSSSWGGADYVEATCKRDVKYILDAARTDLVYGGNERSAIAGDYYFRYPSAATVAGAPSATAQLDPTYTGILWANRLVQKVVVNQTLSLPESDKILTAELLKQNLDFIKDEAIAYLSSSWSNFDYNQTTCKRDIGYIVDAIRTDIVYGGNERSVIAGQYYYKFPSSATVSGSVSPSETAQLYPTLDGIRYAGELARNIVIGTVLSSPSTSKLTAYNLLLDNKRWIQNQTIALINSNIVTQSYNETTCRRDVGYIVDAVATDLLYGGNQRSSEAGRFYYLYPSAATGSQLDQTLEGIGHAKTLSVRIVNNELIYSQFTSSITPAQSEQTKVGTGFDIVLDIIENGTGSIPTLETNASGLIYRTDSVQYQTTASIANTLITSSKNSFDIVLDIVKEGTGSLPTLVKNAAGLLKLTDETLYTNGVVISGSKVNGITGSFDTIISILENGVGSLPTITKNTVSNIRTTGAQQYISGSSATGVESNLISASISIVTDIIANGTGSIITALPTSSYVSTLDEDSKWIAYGILKENIGFIQDETIAYLSSSWSTASYIEEKCRRDVGLIVSGAAEDLLFGSVSASVVNGKFYYEYPSQAQGAQLNQTLDGIFYASELAQKLVQNVVFNLPTSQSNEAYDLLVYNKPFIQDEVISYISSSWSTHIYSESVCRRDVGYILDSVATDIKWGGNQRTVKAGEFYYLYPSEATGSQIQETVTGIKHARNIVEQILRGRQFTQIPHNRLEAKELIFNNKEFIQNEVIAYVSASWNGFEYVEETCKRDVGFILDAVATDLIYGGNERSLEAGEFYYRYPSTATSTQLGPTLSGIRHAKNMVDEILQGNTFVTASQSQIAAYNLILQNKQLIQNETIGYVESAWSFFEYNEGKCRRDTGYIVDAVATDILYGGNERVSEAGEYYYLYPSLATVNNNTTGQLDETLDGVRYAKGLTQKIVANTLLENPTTSEKAGYELLLDNKGLIQNEVIAFLSSSWSGVDGFSYNEAKCKRDVAYIVDNVATDLIYGGNERSSKAGEYYFLYPSAATVAGYANPAAQLDQTTTGIKFASGLAQKLIQNAALSAPSYEVASARDLLRNNISFIQNETIEYVDAFYPSLVYNREKCRRDVGYILDAVITDMVYGGNERGIVAGDYYYRFPSLATGRTQVRETVDAVRYARELSKLIAQNVVLTSPTFTTNIDSNIKGSTATQYTSSVSATAEEVSNISSSFETVTDIIQNGIETLPVITPNYDGLIKVNDVEQITSPISAGGYEVDLVTSSFKLIRDIIYNGSTSIPDSLAANYNYGFQNEEPTTLHITSLVQSLGDGSEDVTSLTGSVSSSYGNVKNIVINGTDSIPTLVENTSASLKVSGVTEVSTGLSGSKYDVNRIGSSFGIVLNIIENGTSVIPTLVPNTSSSIKVTDTPQFISGSAARLQGKVVSSSFGLVIDTLLNNGTSSIQYKAPAATPNTNANVTLAYDLLINNTEFIQSETIAFVSSSWSGFEYNEASCSRDVGLIISGAAYDLLYGGNSASFVNGRFYFDYPSEATSSQLDQTVTALRYAGGMAEKIVQGVIFTSITSSQLEPTSASFELLKANKEFIQSESIAYISSSWSEFEYSESVCKRDIGYIIDAVATDILYGGNERSIVAGDYYYRYPSNATTSELEPTLTGVRYSKGLSMQIVDGSTFQTASAEVEYAYNIIKDNKLFIQSESVAFVNAKFPHLVYDEDKCKRDVGYIVDAVITDLKWGGNERANKAGEFYYLFPSEATGVQVEETTAAVNYARLLTEEIMLNNLIAEPQPIQNTSASIKVTNTPQYITGSEVGTISEANIISQSISILEQILENGTGSIELTLPLPTGSYSTPSNNVNVYYAYNLIKENLDFIKAETIAYMSSSWSTFPYNEASCSRDVGLIVSGAAEDMLYGSLSASLVNAKFYYEYPSQATGSQLQQTLDGIRYAKRITQKVLQNVEFVTASAEVSASYHLLRDNRLFLQSESIAFISSSWDTFVYNQETCKRDISYIVDAVSTDLLYGGNERSVIAGDYYYRYPSNATTSEKDPTATGVEYAGGVAGKLIQNEVFVTASADSITLRQLIRDNRDFIQSETMAYLTASWSTFDYDKVKCRRDVGYILDAAATDLLYGGNERSVTAGKFYYLYPSLATVAGTTNGQLEETLDGIRWASRVTQKVVQNELFVTASSEVSASFDLLRKNKPFIQAETIAYVSSSWSGVYYNEASCSRDVGFLIDAAATDLLYGGQERSVTAGSFYYLFPSRATNAGVPSEQNQLDPTVSGIKYAGRLSSKVILNPTYQSPSASVWIARDLLLLNKTLIQKETITFLSSSWSTLQYNEVSCSRDLGFIIDAVATDLIYGGNERSIEAGSIYYRIPSVAIAESYTDNGEVGQKKQTVDGINFAKGITEKIVNNVTLTPPTTRTREAAQRLLASKEILKEKAIGYTNGAFPYLVYNEASCSRDTGLIVDALVTDLVYGGNERGIAAASSYYTGQYGSAAAVVNDQRTETLETNRYLRTRAEFIAAGAPLEDFGSLIVATGIDYSYNGAGVTFKALPPNQGGSGVANPDFEITELAGGRIFFTSGNQDGDFRIGTGLSINQATGTLVGRTFSKSLFSLVTPFSLALEG